LFYHVVWATIGRAPIIDAGREETIRRSIRTTCSEHGAPIHAIGVMPDHVHLAVSLPPRIAISDFMHALKGSSRHLINRIGADAGHDTFGWQPEYGVLSFGERSLPDVVAYVENQAAHHASDDLRSAFEHVERPYDPAARRRP
jgi:putative transposase